MVMALDDGRVLLAFDGAVGASCATPEGLDSLPSLTGHSQAGSKKFISALTLELERKKYSHGPSQAKCRQDN